MRISHVCLGLLPNASSLRGFHLDQQGGRYESLFKPHDIPGAHREARWHLLEPRHFGDHGRAAAHGGQSCCNAVHIPAGKQAVDVAPQVCQLGGILQCMACQQQWELLGNSASKAGFMRLRHDLHGTASVSDQAAAW